MWDFLESLSNACCEPFSEGVVSDSMKNVDDKKEFQSDFFFDTVSIIESSVSSWSGSDSSNQRVPLQCISFTCGTSMCDEQYTREYSASPTPSDERRDVTEELSSLIDTASFMTPEEGDNNDHLFWEKVDDECSSLSDLPFDESHIKNRGGALRRSTKATGKALHRMETDKEDTILNRWDDTHYWKRRQNGKSAGLDNAGKQILTQILTRLHERRSNSPVHCDLSYLGKVEVTPEHSPARSSSTSSSNQYSSGSPQSRSSPSSRTCPTTPSYTRNSTPKSACRYEGSPAASCDSTVFADLDDVSVESWGVQQVPQWGAAARHMFQNIDLAFATTRIKAATTIQRAARGFLARILASEKLGHLMRDTAALIIQDAWLTHLSKKSVQRKKSSKVFPEEPWHPIFTDTILSSPEGCEVLFGAMDPPAELKRTSSMGHSVSNSSLMSSCDLHRCPSYEDEDDMAFMTVSADGQSGPTIWEMSPARKDFERARLAMKRLPSITEVDEDEEATCSEDDVSISEENTVSSRGEADSEETNHELELLDLAVSDCSCLVPPPQVRRRAHVPLFDDDEDDDCDSICSSNDPEEDVTDFSSKFRHCRISTRVFGIMELAIWLQAVARMFSCQKRYQKLRHAVVSIQRHFRRQRAQEYLMKKNEALIIQRWVRRRNAEVDGARKSHSEREVQVAGDVLSRESQAIVRKKSARPPLYPECGSPRSSKKSTSPGTIRRVTKKKFDLDRIDHSKTENDSVIAWPIPVTHYHHRTQLLAVPKVTTSPSFDCSLVSKNSNSIVGGTQTAKARGSLDLFAAGFSDCQTLENFMSWTSCSDKQEFTLCDDISENQQNPDECRNVKEKEKIASAVSIQQWFRRSIYWKTFHRRLSLRRLNDGQRNDVIKQISCETQDREQIKESTQIDRTCFLLCETKQQQQLAGNAAIKIQSHVRAYHCRKRFTCTIRAVSTIQTFIQVMICRRDSVSKHSKARQALKESCSIEIVELSGQDEMTRATQQIYPKFECQRELKGYVNFSEHSHEYQNKAATLVQRIYRGRKHRISFRNSVIAAISIQKAVRCLAARNRFNRRLQALVFIQRFIRQRNQQKDLHIKTQKAVLVLQKHERGRSARSRFLAAAKIALHLRRLFRGNAHRANFKKVRGAAIRIQKSVRCRIARCQFLLMRSSIIFIQRTFRRKLRRGRNTTTAIVILQKHVRRIDAQRKIVAYHFAARKIQRYFLRFISRLKFRKVLLAVVKLQSMLRTMICVKQFRLKLVEARHRSLRHLAAVKFQCLFRAYFTRLRYHEVVRSTVSLQRFARARIIRWRFIMQKRAAQTIQTFVRHNLQEKLCLKHAYAIQRALFLHGEARKQPEMAHHPRAMKSPSIVVTNKRSQIVLSSYTAATVIQRAVRLMLRKKFRKCTSNLMHSGGNLAIPQDDCTWAYAASQCLVHNDEIYCATTESFSAMFEVSKTAVPSQISISHETVVHDEARRACRKEIRKRRSKAASKIFYASVMSAAIVACAFHFPMNVQPASAAPKTALELQLRAVQSQATRSKDQADVVEQRIRESLNVPLFFEKAASTLTIVKQNKMHEKVQKKIEERDSTDKTQGKNDEFEKLLKSHLSALETVHRLETTIRSLVQDASLQMCDHIPEHTPKKETALELVESTPSKKQTSKRNSVDSDTSNHRKGETQPADISRTITMPTWWKIDESTTPIETELLSTSMTSWWACGSFQSHENSPVSSGVTSSESWSSLDTLESTESALTLDTISEVPGTSTWFDFFSTNYAEVVPGAEEMTSEKIEKEELLLLAKDPSRAFLNEWRFLI